MERKGFKEFLRKKIVYLKRNTKVISMFLIILSCVIFTFKLSVHSQGVMYVSSGSMALLMFIITLISFLSIFAFIGFKKFNKKSLAPLCITLAMLVLQVVLDIIYISAFKTSIATDAHEGYIPALKESVKWMSAHVVFLGMAIASIPLLPVISKLLGLINVEIKEDEPEYLADGEVLVDEIN